MRPLLARPRLALGRLAALALVTAATAPAQAAVGSSEPSASPPDAAALVARDGLLDTDPLPGYEPSLESSFRAELDGAPPTELVIVTSHPVAEAASATQVHPYRWDGARWAPLPALSCGGYMEAGYVEPVDLDRDGQHELLLVGDTDSVVPADLSVVRWQGDAWRELVWGEDPGAAYVVGDVDGDGQDEVVALPVLADQPPVVLGLSPPPPGALPGDWLLPEPAPPLERWLPTLLGDALANPQAHRVEGLVALADEADLPLPASLVPALVRAWDTSHRYERAPLATALALTDAAWDFLVARAADADPPGQALGRALGAHPDPTVREAVLRRLASARGRDDVRDSTELYAGALPGFAAHRDARLRDAVAAAIADPSASEELRGDLLFWVLPADPALAPLLVTLLLAPPTPELARLAAATAQRAAGPFSPSPEAWPLLDPTLGRSLLKAEHPDVRALGRDLLRPPGETPPHRTHAELAPEPWREALAHVAAANDLAPLLIALRRAGPRADGWDAVRARVIELSESPEARLRQTACQTLGWLPGNDARDALIARLADPQDWVRAAAAESLGRLGGDGAVRALLAALPNQGPYERSQFLGALAMTRHPDAMARLAALLPDPSARFALRSAGADGGRVLAAELDGHPLTCEALPLLLALAQADPIAAQDRLPAVRAACEEPEDSWLPGLIDSWERAGAGALSAPLATHPSRTVRLAAWAALRRAEGTSGQ